MHNNIYWSAKPCTYTVHVRICIYLNLLVASWLTYCIYIRLQLHNCICVFCFYYSSAYGCPYNGDVEYYYDNDSPPQCYRSYQFCDYEMYRNYYYYYRHNHGVTLNCSKLFIYIYIHIYMYCIRADVGSINEMIVITCTYTCNIHTI